MDIWDYSTGQLSYLMKLLFHLSNIVSFLLPPTKKALTGRLWLFVENVSAVIRLSTPMTRIRRGSVLISLRRRPPDVFNHRLIRPLSVSLLLRIWIVLRPYSWIVVWTRRTQLRWSWRLSRHSLGLILRWAWMIPTILGITILKTLYQGRSRSGRRGCSHGIIMPRSRRCCGPLGLCTTRWAGLCLSCTSCLKFGILILVNNVRIIAQFFVSERNLRKWTSGILVYYLQDPSLGAFQSVDKSLYPLQESPAVLSALAALSALHNHPLLSPWPLVESTSWLSRRWKCPRDGQ